MNIVVWVLMLSILAGYSGDVSRVKPSVDEQIIVAVYPTGTSSETYYFALTTDGELSTEKGTRVGDDMTQTPFIIKDSVYDYKCEKQQLSSSEISKIIDLASKVYKGDFVISDTVVDDSWDVQIFYKGKVVKQNYWNGISPQVKELVDEFIRLSPVEVDLHGWS